MRSRKNSFFSAITISLCIHALALFLFVNHEIKLKKILLMSTPPERKRIITLFDKKIIKKYQHSEVSNKQIVSTSRSDNLQVPEKTRFSGEINQSVDRETVARHVAAFQEKSQGNGQNSTGKKNEMHKTTKTLHHLLKENPVLNLSNIGQVHIGESEEFEKNSQMVEDLEKHNGGNGEVASNNDFIEDIPLGDATNLNTVENKYFGFYHRIKLKLEQYWGNSIQERARGLYKRGRRMPANENLITSLIVEINSAGDIVSIKIEGSSGIRELDQTAVESFNKAGPFPNPPKGLLVDGRATIQWGFVIKS